jgi:RNA polymerase sigma factor (sigma-70 family)
MLYDCYVGRVHALTLRILGNPMLAEEAVQDTFLKLWSRSREYQPERGLLLSWLLTIARRTALDRLRLEGRRPTLSDSNDPTEAWQVIPEGDSLGRRMPCTQVHGILLSASFTMNMLQSPHGYPLSCCDSYR